MEGKRVEEKDPTQITFIVKMITALQRKYWSPKLSLCIKNTENQISSTP